ncbi:hypothetical protein [Yoonia sp. SS1-5]|uniref:Uncharacterized protein n=1 Tax=Yoonia rhodophyticola TaxID=3137370 RepID=A0AAN0MCR6_9RHOB
MGLTILACAVLPFAANAQTAAEITPTEPVQQSQSCPVGTVWDGARQSCAAGSDQTASPLYGLPDRSNCGGRAHQQVTS